jgi:pyruvate/2-oxoglutarate dehydrogenase complex dihydrolipoamide dehydrogenase (E3) component
MEKYDIAIVGYGITGMIVLAILQNKLPNVRVAIIDPYFDGGALIREYGNVISNTPLVKLINALKLLDLSYEIPSEYSNYNVNETTPLYVLVHIIKDLIKMDYDRYETKVKSINNTIITNEDATKLEAKIIILCQGSEPKTLQTEIPVIPLHIALNKDLLQRYVKSSDKVIVFGTAHSGTLVLQNLELLNISTTAIYNKDKPFYFAKDGYYDGIKEDAERIAQDILNNKYKNITLLNTKSSNIDKIIKVTKKASYVVYAIGFKTRYIEIENIDSTKYDSKTGKITDNIYGFGIAYPSSAPDNIHYDVGVYAFMEHILNQIENIFRE